MIISAVLGLVGGGALTGFMLRKQTEGVGNGWGCQGVDGCVEVSTRNADEPTRGVRNHDQEQRMMRS